MKKSRGPRQPGGGRKAAGPRHRGRPAAPRHGDARGEHGQRGERGAKGDAPGRASPRTRPGRGPRHGSRPDAEAGNRDRPAADRYAEARGERGERRTKGDAPGRASFKTRPGRGPRHGKRPDAEAGNRDRPAADRYAEARGERGTRRDAPGRASFKPRPGRGPRHGSGRHEAEAGNRDRPAVDRYAERRPQRDSKGGGGGARTSSFEARVRSAPADEAQAGDAPPPAHQRPDRRCDRRRGRHARRSFPGGAVSGTELLPYPARDPQRRGAGQRQAHAAEEPARSGPVDAHSSAAARCAEAAGDRQRSRRKYPRLPQVDHALRGRRPAGAQQAVRTGGAGRLRHDAPPRRHARGAARCARSAAAAGAPAR